MSGETQHVKYPSKKIHRIKTHQHVALLPLALLIRAWTASLRFHISDSEKQLLQNPPSGSLVLLWHNRLFVIAEIRRRFCPGASIHGLISASKDGAWLAGLYELLGIKVIRGSNNYRASQALRNAYRILLKGEMLAITPDGPRGPVYHPSNGPVFLADKSQCKLCIITTNFHRFKRLHSWDGFYLPHPFSQVNIHADFYRNIDELTDTVEEKEPARALQIKMMQHVVDPQK